MSSLFNCDVTTIDPIEIIKVKFGKHKQCITRSQLFDTQIKQKPFIVGESNTFELKKRTEQGGVLTVQDIEYVLEILL